MEGATDDRASESDLDLSDSPPCELLERLKLFGKERAEPNEPGGRCLEFPRHRDDPLPRPREEDEPREERGIFAD
jgi:hypothetical protein